MTIRNPIEWGADQVKSAAQAIEEAGKAVYHPAEGLDSLRPKIHRIAASDLTGVLAAGFADFAACRTDVLFIGLLYPIIGLILEQLAFGQNWTHLLFPIASGFALVGPFAATGLYEMSRRREQGKSATWADALDVFRSPSFGAILVLGVILITLYVLWIFAAETIYGFAFGADPPASITAFAHDVFATSAGWAMVVVGVGVGFLFALLAMAISVVAFPLLVERPVGVDTAIWTSVRAVTANPVPMALWGLIVTAGLVLGALPAFAGLIVVLPVLGHATWHLYRVLVAR